MGRHCDTTLKLAHDLKAHPAIERVFYPGLCDHPQHALAARQMKVFDILSALAKAEAIRKVTDAMVSI